MFVARMRSLVAVTAAVLLFFGGIVATAPSQASVNLAGTCCWAAAR